LEEAEQKAAKKKKKKEGQGQTEGASAGAPKYKNAADLIRTMTKTTPKQV